MIKKVLKFFKVWNELLSVPLAILLFWASPYFLRMIDPTAAAYDAGILQQIVVAVVAVLVFNGMAWLLLKLNFPGVYKYFDEFFEKNLQTFPTENGLKSLNLWQKSLLVFLLFALYFLGFILGFMAV